MSRQGRKTQRSRPIIILIILLAVFLIPWGVARLMYWQRDKVGKPQVNHGVLLQHSFKISLLPLKNAQGQLLDNVISAHKVKPAKTHTTNGQWLLMLLVPPHCGGSCQQRLFDLRQIRLATGKNKQRIERAALTFSASNTPLRQLLKQPKYRGTRFLSVKQQRFRQVIAQHKRVSTVAIVGSLYVVDPLGNVMMVYRPSASRKHIYQDIKRLLKVSQIG